MGEGGGPYGFPGEWWTSYTNHLGVLFLRARFYAPYLNRFISPDPIIPDYSYPPSIHQYTYVYNNPLKYVDRGGHPCAYYYRGHRRSCGGCRSTSGNKLNRSRKHIRDVNWAEVGGAASGGFVAGATLGLAPAGASTLLVTLLGGAGSTLGGQAQALTQAGIEELLGCNPQGSVVEEAQKLG